MIEAVGLEVTRQMAIASVGQLGRIGWLGLHTAVTSADFSHMIRQQVTSVGTYSARPSDVRDAIEALSDGVLRHLDWIQSYPLSEGADVYRMLVESPDQVTKAVLRP